MSLGSFQTRDGPFNTNNYIESAFRVFDTVMLELVQNKRSDMVLLHFVHHEVTLL
jgi:hypothetical protein